MRLSFGIFLTALAMANTSAADSSRQTETGTIHPYRAGEPLASTYSIVARDAETGQLGVAVQSHWFSVGSVVPSAESGVGAVATQSITDPSYGSLGLALMRSGKSAPDSLRSLIAGDSGAAMRQVAMIDATGRAAAHTGARCIAEAGNLVGEGYSVQANLMLKDTVWPAMAKAYETSEGDLAERLMAALEAAQREGGDIRGRQSAALLVVRGTTTGKPWADRLFDLRIEDHATPIVELRRLVDLRRAYLHMDEGDEHMAADDVDGALVSYSAAEKLAPDNIEMVFWHAVSLVNADRTVDSLPLFRRVFASDKNWITVVPRIRRSGFLPDDDDTMKQILAVAP